VAGAQTVVLDNGLTRAEIVGDEGARVRSLLDARTARELLYRRPGEHWDPGDYVATLAGGWDQMFPNDDAWDGFPVHGLHWSARFRAQSASSDGVSFRCELIEAGVVVVHEYSLLPPPRSGLRLETTVRAQRVVPPFLWSTHPMLAVAPGWEIDVGDVVLEADAVDPGRVHAGPLERAARDVALVAPERSQGWQEVLYAPASGTASVRSLGSGSGTEVRWDVEFFRYLWVVTLSGFASVDLAVVLEPCTTYPYRLDEAVANGSAMELGAGEERSFWSEVESLDRP
jgi:hypothetical protein